MDRLKVNAFRKEFSFLAEMISDEKVGGIDNIEVKRVDIGLLGSTPSSYGATGNLVGIDSIKTFHFVLDDGTFIRNAVKDEGSWTHNEAYRDNESWEGETVLAAIDKNQVGDRIAYIVLERIGYKIRDHYSVGGHSFTVYLPPTGKPISHYLMEAHQQTAESVKAEIAEVRGD